MNLIDDVPAMVLVGNYTPYVQTVSVYLPKGYHKLEIGHEDHDDVALVQDFYVRQQHEGIYLEASLFCLESISG